MSNAIDPNVLGLFQGVRRDPNSGLMRLSRATLARRGGTVQDAVSEKEPLLSRAERHLLKEYRAEAAYMLLKACQRSLDRLAPWQSMVHLTKDGGLVVTIPEDDWFDEAKQRCRTNGVTIDARMLDGLSEREGTGPSPIKASEFAAASLLLYPRDDTRVWLALALSAEGQEEACGKVTKDVLAHHPTVTNGSFALQNLGWVELVSDRPASAKELYLTSFTKDPRRVSPLLAALHAALATGDTPSILDIAGRIAEFRDESSEAVVQEHVDLWRSRKEHGVFAPAHAVRQTTRKIVEDLPPQARRVADVFL